LQVLQKNGHIESKCYKKKYQDREQKVCILTEKKEDKETLPLTACEKQESSSHSDFVVDSGWSDHMVPLELNV
jgi:hypothetical protein